MKPLRILITAALAAVVVGAAPVPAYAHATLVSSDPADGAELETAPQEVTLEFSEELDEPSTQIAVTHADGDVVSVEPVIEGATATIPVVLPRPGLYTVSYRIVSVDGHSVDGTIGFETAAGADVTASPVDPTIATAEPTDDGAAEDAVDDGGTSWGLVFGVIAGIAVVGGVVVFLLRRGRGTPGTGGDA